MALPVSGSFDILSAPGFCRQFPGPASAGYAGSLSCFPKFRLPWAAFPCRFSAAQRKEVTKRIMFSRKRFFGFLCFSEPSWLCWVRLSVLVDGSNLWNRYTEAGTLIGPVLWLMIPWTAGNAVVRVLMARKLDFRYCFARLTGAAFFL